MATVKFAQMATKKLQKLVNDPATSDEDKVAIQAVLDKRQAAVAPAAGTQEQAALSPEEQAAIDAAEKEAAKQHSEAANGDATGKQAKPKKTPKPKAVKQTMDELDAECEKATAEALAHRCEAIMPGTAIKATGYVKGVLKEKRAMKCYLLIQSDVTEENPTGRQFYKVFSEVTILPETVELHKAKKTRERRTSAKNPEEWCSSVSDVVEAAGVYVGRQVNLGDEETPKMGEIKTIVKDKRACTVFFRINFTDENGIAKITHKAVHYTKDEVDGNIVISDPEGLVELTDETKPAYDEAQNHWATRADRMPRATLTPEEKLQRAKDALDKAQKNLEKAQETLQNKQLEYNNAKAALDAKLNEHEAGAEAEAQEAADAAAGEAAAGDLM